MQCLDHVNEDTEEGRECGLFVDGEDVSHTHRRGAAGRTVMWVGLGTISQHFENQAVLIWRDGECH